MIISKGAPRDWGGEVRDTAPQIDILKNRFWRHRGINCFTWCILQPKSAKEIGWWLVY